MSLRRSTEKPVGHCCHEPIALLASEAKRWSGETCQIGPNDLISDMRSKEFDPDDVLQEALKTFWQQGFEGTNMPELLDSMGVGRASFYNAFGSKREVFLRILDLYFETVRAHLEGLISDVRDPRAAVALLIDGTLAVAKSPKANATGWRGCLIGNTALELGANDEEIVDRLKIGVEILRALFRKAISLPSSAGVRRSKREVDQLALQLVANVQGLLVLAKSGLSDADIKSARSAMLATIS
jgi:TetR/AcrR family transcriptional regulator, transcriptional repressor for nem operon